MKEDDLTSMSSDHLDYEVDAQDPPSHMARWGQGPAVAARQQHQHHQHREPSAAQLAATASALQRRNRHLARDEHANHIYNFARNAEGAGLARGDWMRRLYDGEPTATDICNQYWESIGM